MSTVNPTQTATTFRRSEQGFDVFGLRNQAVENGYHHLALEPTNGVADALTDAVKAEQSGMLAPRGKQSWQVTLRIET